MGKRHALVAALLQVAHGAAFILLALSGRFLLAAAMFWLTYLARSGWNSPHATLFHRDVPTHRRSLMLSAQSLAGFAGAFLGSIALGALADASSIGAAWFVAGAVLLVSAVPYLRLDTLDRRARLAQASAIAHPADAKERSVGKA
jgi:MFS family permease